MPSSDCAAGLIGNRSSRLIIALAARHRLPAVYQYRQAAGYVERILKGAEAEQNRTSFLSGSWLDALRLRPWSQQVIAPIGAFEPTPVMSVTAGLLSNESRGFVWARTYYFGSITIPA